MSHPLRVIISCKSFMWIAKNPCLRWHLSHLTTVLVNLFIICTYLSKGFLTFFFLHYKATSQKLVFYLASLWITPGCCVWLPLAIYRTSFIYSHPKMLLASGSWFVNTTSVHKNPRTPPQVYRLALKAGYFEYALKWLAEPISLLLVG